MVVGVLGLLWLEDAAVNEVASRLLLLCGDGGDVDTDGDGDGTDDATEASDLRRSPLLLCAAGFSFLGGGCVY